jgi:hypothetical protein
MVDIQREPYTGKELSGKRMYEMVFCFYRDLESLSRLPFPDFFDRVRSIPYATDEEITAGKKEEIAARPLYLLDRKMFPFLDCKKKAILIGSWARANALPFRFLAVSEYDTGEIHHVFPQIDFGAGWVNCDATFSNFKIGMGHPVTRAEELVP